MEAFQKRKLIAEHNMDLVEVSKVENINRYDLVLYRQLS